MQITLSFYPTRLPFQYITFLYLFLFNLFLLFSFQPILLTTRGLFLNSSSLNISKHLYTSSNERKIYSKKSPRHFLNLGSRINVKPLCQTSIGERCRYEMAAFKAGEFVETTAHPNIYIYVCVYVPTIFTAMHVMISDVT